jgi:hypothetical protein
LRLRADVVKRQICLGIPETKKPTSGFAGGLGGGKDETPSIQAHPVASSASS